VKLRRGLACAALVCACAEPEVAAPVAMAGFIAPKSARKPAPVRSQVVPAPTPAPARRVRVATYNILGGELGLAPVIAALRALDAEVIALQEVDRGTRRAKRVDQPRAIAEALGMHVEFAAHPKRGGGRTGVALLSRHPLTNIEHIELPDGVLAALQADVAIDDVVIRTFVVHLLPTELGDPRARQAGMDIARLREADAVLLRATDQRRPTLVLGDFNALSNGPEYAAFADHFEDACPLGGPTWPTSDPTYRIDYVWSSPELRVLGCPSTTPTASDHLPVVALLELTER
jgi:endonuclease/exonuclease/phosphatase family metal-dependent hydrolase